MASLKQLNIDASNLKASSFPLGSLNISTPTPNISMSTFGTLDSSFSKWFGGVLAPNGKIYGIPFDSTTVLEIDFQDGKTAPWAISNYLNKF